MADKAWKAVERRVAVFFSTVRNSLSGGNSKLTRSDSLHQHFFIDCKHRQQFAHHKTLGEIAKIAEQEDKLPVLVTQQKYATGFVVSLRSEDVLTFCRKYLEGKGFKVTRSLSPSPRKETVR